MKKHRYFVCYHRVSRLSSLLLTDGIVELDNKVSTEESFEALKNELLKQNPSHRNVVIVNFIYLGNGKDD